MNGTSNRIGRAHQNRQLMYGEPHRREAVPNQALLALRDEKQIQIGRGKNSGFTLNYGGSTAGKHRSLISRSSPHLR